ncbi:MAG: trypsin-like peptidase domain-containing protein [Dehalococcoidales bacterium]|nr:trypsin-like peptidase domain-containing protein [Dehalococcoidales bacterium]
MKRRYALFVSIMLAFLLAFASCIPTMTPPPTINSKPLPSAPSANALTDIEATLENIYAQANPSVVNIGVVIGSNSTFPQEALGSGFIWDKAGHIVTNNHVIADADDITITFPDGTMVPAKLVGADFDSDLAVVKIDMPADQLKPLSMGDSTRLRVGQLVVAIGNPFGLQGTMTVGFISALGRMVPTDENAMGASYNIPDIIQTDASLNPGNSGGVLLDATGKVIGVTQSMASTSDSSAGVGFAIPSAIVQQVVPSLIKAGRYDHPYLGVSVVSMSPTLATAMNLSATQRGTMVGGITAGSPADKAGLKASQTPVPINGHTVFVGGDIIIAFNDQTVKSSDDLITFLSRSGVIGGTVSLTVLREGKQIKVPVIIGARPGT